MEYQSKKEIRSRMLTLRETFTDKQRALTDLRVHDHILQADFYKNAKTVLFYAAFRKEIGLWQVAEHAFDSGRTVCFPRCDDKDGNMRFYHVTSMQDHIPGMYGILEPAPHCALVTDFKNTDVCLVPGVAFDGDGYRIGYGKGYYDRFLAAFAGISVGICDWQMLHNKDTWEHDRYDKPVHHIITQNGCITVDREAL